MSRHPDGNPFRRIRFSGLFVWLGLAVVVFALTLTSLRMAGAGVSPPVVRNALLLLVYAALLLWLGWGFRAQGIAGRWFFRRPRRWSWMEIVGLTVLFVVFAVGATWAVHLPLERFFPDLVERRLRSVEVLTGPGVRNAPLFNVVEVATIVLLVPFAEELFFRGFLLNRWGRRWGVTTAIVASSVLFALLHVDLVGKLFFGIVLSLLYLETGSLVAPVVVHALNNALAVFLILLSTYAPDLAINEMLDRLQGSGPALVAFFATAPIVLWYTVRHWPGEETSLPRLERGATSG